jgi:hypothetical protein
MKANIKRMAQLLKVNPSKNNINCKKAISGLFTALALLTILTGNSAFISDGIGQSFEKTSCALREAMPIGEEITAVKIASPSRSMIRKADQEMHMNMNAMIKALNSFHIELTESNTADEEINNQFIGEYSINPGFEIFENSDFNLTYQFEAENINMDIEKNLLNADNVMVTAFYLNNYSRNNPAYITAADLFLTETFYADNN